MVKSCGDFKEAESLRFLVRDFAFGQVTHFLYGGIGIMQYRNDFYVYHYK